MNNVSVNVTGLVGGLQHVMASRSALIVLAASGWVLAAILLFVVLARNHDSSKRISLKARALRGGYFQEVKTGIIRNQR